MRWLIIFLSILLLLLQYPLWFSERSLPDAWQLRSKIGAQQAENQQFEERNRLLKAEVEDLKTGLDVVEEKARTELGLIKQGETYYQVIESPVMEDPVLEGQEIKNIILLESSHE